jgi:hypothetical protein
MKEDVKQRKERHEKVMKWYSERLGGVLGAVQQIQKEYKDKTERRHKTVIKKS